MYSYLLLQYLLFLFLLHEHKIFFRLPSPISWLLKTEIFKLISSCTLVFTTQLNMSGCLHIDNTIKDTYTN